MVYGKAHFIDQDDRLIGDYNTAEYSFERLMADCCISQPAAFWRQRVNDLVGPFDEKLHLTMDYDYWQRIDRAGGRIEHLHEFLACTRMHADTKTLSQRTAVFAEAIRVCMKNAGFASLPYFLGLWHHLLYHESKLCWVWRRTPYIIPVMGRLHHRWVNRATYKNREFVDDIARSIKNRLGKKLRPLLARTRHAAKLRPVEGFWGDNWMAETCVVRLKESPAGEHVQLTGVATSSMTLTVAVNNEAIGSFSLQGQKPEAIQFHLEPGPRREVVLKFSNHMVDPAGRKLAFLLSGTNLFSEQDMAA